MCGTLDDYNKLRTIRAGRFGSVHLVEPLFAWTADQAATETGNRQQQVLKVIDISSYKARQQAAIECEARQLTSLQSHPHLLQLSSFCVDNGLLHLMSTFAHGGVTSCTALVALLHHSCT